MVGLAYLGPTDAAGEEEAGESATVAAMRRAVILHLPAEVGAGGITRASLGALVPVARESEGSRMTASWVLRPEVISTVAAVVVADGDGASWTLLPRTTATRRPWARKRRVFEGR